MAPNGVRADDATARTVRHAGSKSHVQRKPSYADLVAQRMTSRLSQNGLPAGPERRVSSGWRAAPRLPAIVETLGSYRRGGDELIEDLPNLDPAGTRDVFSSLAWKQGSCVGLDAALLHGLLVFPDGDGRAVALWGFHVIDGQDAGLAGEGRLESPAGIVFLSPLLLLRRSEEHT